MTVDKVNGANGSNNLPTTGQVKIKGGQDKT